MKQYYYLRLNVNSLNPKKSFIIKFMIEIKYKLMGIARAQKISD